MNCKTCNYALWDLPSRVCPECGTPFKPSDFEFRTSAVRFCCPHCRQAYYGTGINGHLVPRAFNCVQCGNAVDMDEMVVLPTEGVDERDTQPNRVNWPDRANTGFWKSYFVTLGRSMGTPQRCMEAAPPTSSLASAWWFSMFTDLLVMLLGYGGFFLLFMVIGVMAAGGGRGGGGGGAWAPMLGCGGVMIAIVLVTGQVWGLLHGLSAHLVLVASGPTEHGLSRTMQATWYSAGPRIVAAIPCLSQYLWPVGVVWSTVSLILMLIKAQKVSPLRAVFAGTLLPLLALLAGIGLFSWLVYSTGPGVGPGGPWNVGTANVPISGPSGAGASVGDGGKAIAVLTAVRGRMTSGTFAHALELVGANEMMAYDLVLPSGQTSSPSSVRLGMTTLDQFTFKRPSERKQIIDNIIASWPTGSACYTLGAFTFAHTGVDLAKADPATWLIVSEPIGGYPSPTVTTSTIWVRLVGRADGTIDVIPVSTFDAALKDQNALRSAAGFPQLPASAFAAPAPSTPVPTPAPVDEEF